MGTGAYPFRLPDRLRDVFGRRKVSALAQAGKAFPREGLAIFKRDLCRITDRQKPAPIYGQIRAIIG